MHLPIDEIVENGIAFNLRRKMPMYDIRATVRALFADLHTAKVDYVLVGGVALLSYIEGRNTQDVDLIIAPKQLKKIDWQATIQDKDSGKANYHGFQVDLLLGPCASYNSLTYGPPGAKERRSDSQPLAPGGVR